MHLKRIKFSLLATSVLLAGCADITNQLKSKYQHREVKQAPQSKDETGVIVSNASENDIAEILQVHPQSRFRVISNAHGFYEVFGVSEKTLSVEMPQLNPSTNIFIPHNPTEKRRPLDASHLDKFLALNSSGDPKKLNKCVKALKAPSTSLLVNGVELVEKNLTIELGQTLNFDGSKSLAHEDVGDSVRVAFAMQPTPDSLIGEKLTFQDKMQLIPDAYGLYKVVMVVQDKEDVCAYQTVSLTITGNPELEDVESGATESLTPFSHLSEMQAEKSWEISTGKGMVIAIIDTGVHYNHPDLNSNIYVNSDEIAGNGADDDGNGYVDDAYGYDFTNSDPFPFDDVGHGTHVAGLAAASTFGLAKDAKIMALKAMGPAGGDLGSILKAVLYAVNNGADILNMSLGAYNETPHPKMVEVMDFAESKGILVIAASGNGHPQLGIGMDTDIVPNYPSALPNDNIVAVAAKDSYNLLAPYSNYGEISVDITAPGGGSPSDSITSSYMENPSDTQYRGMTGTSMAAPIVAGVAAQVWSLDPDQSALEVKDALLNSGIKVEGLDTRTVSGRYLDAYRAVSYVKMRDPN